MVGKNFISVHDTSLVKHSVCNETYARTRTVSKGRVRKPVHTAFGQMFRKICRGSHYLFKKKGNCDFNVWTTRLFVPTRHHAHFTRIIRSWYSQETT